MHRRVNERVRGGGWLRALARDVRGNVLMITAAALIPLTAMIGGGLDLSRMYLVKTRLQHACDAGSLAGRKAMGSGVFSDSSNTAHPQSSANAFFDANYLSTAYGGTSLSRVFTESGGTVSGNASVVLPMTLMRVLGFTTKTLTVTCDARMQLPNTDVMFVLDTSGSMNCTPSATSCAQSSGTTPASGSKIDALKLATKCFFEIATRMDTDASCVAGTPTGAPWGAQVRIGVVSYSMNVNVGRLLPTSYLANNWDYQSRKWNSGGNKWDYKQYTGVDVSGLKNGTAWRAGIDVAQGTQGATITIPWEGCIEERATVQQTNYSPIPAGAKDLNIDLLPDPNDSTTLWKPSLVGLQFVRAVTSTSSWSNASSSSKSSSSDYVHPQYICPSAASKLKVWANGSDFSTYINSLVASGGTYHDIGMLWGARLLSPTGIFASENALTPQGGTIQRHLIFMTDGDSHGEACDYNAYGIPFFDKRQTNSVGAASDCDSGNDDLNDQIDARLNALCTAVKNMNVTLWVIAYGKDIGSATVTRLTNCASPGRYFAAASATDIQTTFSSIANQISQLRLTK